MRKKIGFLRTRLAIAASVAVASLASGFPPAPHHLVKGQVRDSMGYVIEDEGTVVLTTVSGVKIETPLAPALYLDSSYRLEVPMDAGVAPDSYKPTALNPLAPFTMRIQIGSQTYVPIEMNGDLSALGEAGGTTVIDLTLGVDSDNDGIPDDWELSLISRTSRYNSLDDVNPDDDLDGDGLTNYEEYLAHTYAYDVLDGLDLKIVSVTENGYVIEFLAITDHSYTILGSTDAIGWSEQPFKLLLGGSSDETLSQFEATEVQVVRAEIAKTEGGPNLFKLVVR